MNIGHKVNRRHWDKWLSQRLFGLNESQVPASIAIKAVEEAVKGSVYRLEQSGAGYCLSNALMSGPVASDPVRALALACKASSVLHTHVVDYALRLK